MGEGCTRNRPPPQSVCSSTWTSGGTRWSGTVDRLPTGDNAEKGFGPYRNPRFNDLQMWVAKYMCDVGEDERLGLGTGWPAEQVWQKIELSGSVPDVQCMTLQLERPAHQLRILVAHGFYVAER